MGEAMGSVPLTAMFGRLGVPVYATWSRFLSWDDFRREHLIVAGHNEQNPWVVWLLAGYPLQMLPAGGDGNWRIVNTASHAGEPLAFELDTAQQAQH